MPDEWKKEKFSYWGRIFEIGGLLNFSDRDTFKIRIQFLIFSVWSDRLV